MKPSSPILGLCSLAPATTAYVHRGHLENSRNINVQRSQGCGPGIGSCPSGLCCNTNGECGKTTAFCMQPNCQLDYSDSCLASIPPRGDRTDDVPRPKLGPVPYGTLIDHCVVPGTVALSFDDGPFEYTEPILDVLERHGAKATFFVCGNNNPRGPVDDPRIGWPAVLRRMHAAGHQVASHTWSHLNLSTASPAVRVQQVLYNEMALRNVLGVFPAYMRPPYGSCEAEDDNSSSHGSGGGGSGGGGLACLPYLGALGYHVVNYDLDTRDYSHDAPELIQASEDIFSGALRPPGAAAAAASSSFMELSHDTHLQTAANLTEFMVRIALERGYRPVTVGECLGNPPENWYRDASGTTAGTYDGADHHQPDSSAEGKGAAHPLPTVPPGLVAGDDDDDDNDGGRGDGVHHDEPDDGDKSRYGGDGDKAHHDGSPPSAKNGEASGGNRTRCDLQGLATMAVLFGIWLLV